MQSLYEEYAQLEAEIGALESKKEQLRPMILKQMVENGLESMKTALGSFSVTKMKVWTFPPRIVEMEETFKAEKEKAKSTEEATYVEKESLRFTQIKL